MIAVRDASAAASRPFARRLRGRCARLGTADAPFLRAAPAPRVAARGSGDPARGPAPAAARARGACLPDLALAGRALGVAAFRGCHGWPTLRRFAAAATDEERAIALGYASHLLADVVAHNAFVPEHEARIARVAMATHALCEWAMDEHVRPAAFVAPEDVLEAERDTLAAVAAARLRCEERLVRRALELLARANRLLRRLRIAALSRRIARRFDHLLAARFDAYARETVAALAQVGPALEGIVPAAEPEPAEPVAFAPAAAGRLRPPASLA
ncbi:MAG: zinc dependent phospholipase C family protein [Burkholderiales bacterium]|nr:zinc dependent phospholipase C family protein [Burkholderiales bacterium]